MPDGTLKKFPIYFYSRDGHIFQIKPDLPTYHVIFATTTDDGIRGSAVSDNKEDRDLMRNLVYQYCGGGTNIVNDDVEVATFLIPALFVNILEGRPLIGMILN